MAAISGYRKKVGQAIALAAAHIDELMGQIPGPIDLNPDQWADQPVLHSMFTGPHEILTTLKSSPHLIRFFKSTGNDTAVALLAADFREKTVFGVEKSNDIIRRDVPKKAVYFENQNIYAPAATVDACRFRIKHLALIALCRQVTQSTSGLEEWKKELQNQQHLLEFKLGTQKFNDPDPSADESVIEAKQVLGEIKAKIHSINSQVNATPDHLARIIQAFETAGTNLVLEQTPLKLDRLGFRLNAESTEPAFEFTVAGFRFGKNEKMAGIWVQISRDFLKSPASGKSH